jgi:hypothetical protein
LTVYDTVPADRPGAWQRAPESDDAMEMQTATSAAAVRTAAGEPTRQPRWRGNPRLTLLTVALGVMMVALDGTIVAVANPAIQSHLHASLAGIQWVTNAYLLALAVSLITIGKLATSSGTRRSSSPA